MADTPARQEADPAMAASRDEYPIDGHAHERMVFRRGWDQALAWQAAQPVVVTAEGLPSSSSNWQTMTQDPYKPAVPAVDQGLREKALAAAYAAPEYESGATDFEAVTDAVLAVVDPDGEGDRRGTPALRWVRAENVRIRAARDAASAREGALRAGVEALAEQIRAKRLGTGQGPLWIEDAARALLVEPGGER